MAKSPILNIDEIEYSNLGDGGKFEARLGRISTAIGAMDLGYNITVVPPGKRAFPYHRHHAIEEMFFILEGEGTLRYDGNEFPLKKGDVVACPAGSRGAHQIVNTGTEDMRYLAVSTNQSPDVVEYPDSGKLGAMAGDFSNPDTEMEVRLFVKQASGVAYYDGESD